MQMFTPLKVLEFYARRKTQTKHVPKADNRFCLSIPHNNQTEVVGEEVSETSFQSSLEY